VKKFEFRFQSVLENRRDHEEEHKKALADLTRVMDAQKNRLERMGEERAACEEEIRSQIHDGARVAHAMLFLGYLAKLAGEIETQQRIATQVARKTEEKRQDLIEAVKERRILERLSERERLGFLKQVEKAEQQFLDQISLNTYVRDMASPEE